MRSDDPDDVRAEYETEHVLAARPGIYGAGGVDARDVVIQELERVEPARVLATTFRNSTSR